MIARNYTKHPEALRFQRELFSNGFHNSPRIMRLIECIFDWTPAVPGWWTAAKNRARALAKAVKKSIADFFKEMNVTASEKSAPPAKCKPLEHQFGEAKALRYVEFPVTYGHLQTCSICKWRLFTDATKGRVGDAGTLLPPDIT